MSTTIQQELPNQDVDLAATGRWILGHQTFHVQLIAMLSLLDRCQDGLDRDDRRLLVRSLDDLRALFDATTANMVYTASFSPVLYAQAVRPSMMPPFLSPGFSGQLSHEHHMLLEDFGRLRRALQVRWGDAEPWPEEVAVAWRQVGEAISRNRKHHGLVCQRFVPGGSSLLTHFMAKRIRREENPQAGETQHPTHGDQQ